MTYKSGEILHTEKRLVKQKVEPKGRGVFGSAVRALRLSLGLTQEQAAHRIGVTLGAWTRWEGAIHAPRLSRLEKILALCPNAETRADFGLQIADAVGQNARAAAPQPKSPEDVKKLRARTMAIQAIQILYEAALDGAPGAEEKLVATADSLLESAGKYDRAKPRGK